MLPTPPDRPVLPADLADDELLFLPADADFETLPPLEVVDLLLDDFVLELTELFEAELFAVDFAPDDIPEEDFADPAFFAGVVVFVDPDDLADPDLFVDPDDLTDPDLFAEPDDFAEPEVFEPDPADFDVPVPFFAPVVVADFAELAFPVELDFDADFFVEPVDGDLEELLSLVPVEPFDPVDAVDAFFDPAALLAFGATVFATASAVPTAAPVAAPVTAPSRISPTTSFALSKIISSEPFPLREEAAFLPLPVFEPEDFFDFCLTIDRLLYYYRDFTAAIGQRN